ncbi:helix-turn-helix domain-containing protein [Lutimonas zeaxanthinifaciens]|uniref:helix-turn-helix domain-containing protein n=1 Tax=Lutimonas zeaxanthinifaciens TaxID=3060215 RepID=UPI00265D281D|nr:helix-turn-helix transcriptional regulator [Lutimonas sp. YSD2104]WKK67034.1 helix-turn-helix transcriptional regulator [Lutimonas sp. YSD2104]
MSIYLRRILPFIIFLIGNYCYGQYSISGYLDTPEKNKRVYLCLLKFDELNAIGSNQILTSTVTDSLGYFSFEGSLLSDKHALYRIYANLDEDVEGVQKYDMEDLKNFHNFIFSNKDTIVFEKNKKFWFSSNSNTNSIDKEWNAYGSYIDKLRAEFSDFNNQEMIKQTTEQFLSELKSFVLEKETHPLTTLILLGSLPESGIKKDLNDDPEFYVQLLGQLNDYYDNSSYALQYRSFLDDQYRSETKEDLAFFKKLSYALGFLCLLFLGGLVFLSIKLKQAGIIQQTPIDFSLTTQEEKVAELMIDNKTNKEIASELFISLNTVKTHIRNLYAKLEVSNRTEFVEKFKNHPRD